LSAFSAVVGRRLLLALAPLFLLLELPGAFESWDRAEDGLKARDRTIMVVQDGGPAQRAGLAPHDRILALDGRTIHNYGSYLAAMHGKRAGDTVELRVRRAGTEATVRLALTRTTASDLAKGFLQSAVGLCFVFLGFATYLRRADPLGRYFYLSCLLFAYNFLDLPTFPWPGVMHFLEGLRNGLQLVLAAAFLRFFLMFPEGVDRDPRRHRQRRWLFAAPLLFAPMHVVLHFAREPAMESGWAKLLAAASALLAVSYIATGIWIFVRKSMRRDRYAHWSQMRLAAGGVVTGLSPLLVATLLRQFWPTQEIIIGQAAVFFLPLVPASFSIALLRSGTLNLPQLSRQALGAFIAALPIVVLGGVLARFARSGMPTDRFAAALVIATAALFAGALGFATLRRRVVATVDRIFYPQQRRVRSAVAELADALSQERDLEDLAALFCSGIRDLLDARRVVLYAFQGDEAICLSDCGTPFPEPPERMSRGSSLFALLGETHDLLFVPPMIHGPTARRIDEASHRLIELTDAVVLCPLISSGEMTAALLCSAPTDGREYGALELYHVQQLARQCAGSLENARLHREDVARARMRTELGLAREIQSKLLPQDDLQVGEFEICGRMKASMQVGGDLYDHFRLGDGTVVVGVADAAGKGVPASLLMSSIRSSIREIMRPGLSTDDAMKHVNAEVHKTTAETHFIAMFLGLLRPDSGVFEYTVAGIEPPLWVRRDLGRAELLTRGGPVLGVQTDVRYRSGLIRLRPGDVVLAYSDGMIDEENAEEEHFGLSRLRAKAMEFAGCPAGEILEKLMAAVANYGADEATDDRTLLVIKRQDEAAPGTNPAAL
jgi:sigma-B regulation protein RsbU (phosphoserine phosphatase)